MSLKRISTYLLMGVSFIGVLLSLLLGIKYGFGSKLVILVFIISIILLCLSGLFLSNIREVEDYDEFGNNKKLTRRKMSSKDRTFLEIQNRAETNRIITDNELKSLVKDGSDDPLGDLEKMVGMGQVKENISNLIARMEFNATSKKVNSDGEMRHMLFYGPPGTGKTAIARIVTGAYYEYGYLSKNKLVEVDGNTLKSRNASDTEKKVRIIAKKAMGGVLFIDEAYALTQSGDANGLQAIATLIKIMEDERDNLVVILAGYKEEMTEMLNANPGFRSRIKDYVQFNDYSYEELFEIGKTMAKEKGFSLPEEARQRFMFRVQAEQGPKWGNARTVRSIIEESIDNHAANYIRNHLPKSLQYVITPEDIAEEPKQYI